MKLLYRILFSFAVISLVVVVYTLTRNGVEYKPVIRSNSSSQQNVAAEINPLVLVVVVCGDRINETLVMLKSARTLTRVPMRFIIFTEDELKPYLNAALSSWPIKVFNNLTFDIYPITFPQDAKTNWKTLFKPCASQRLFLPSVLSDVDSVIYVDTDVLFLRPLDHLWNYFNLMNVTHLAALSPEHEDYSTGWYNRFAKHPYYKPLGVNSGVMLMNLTRMRNFKWVERVGPIYERYKMQITWGDQDILNILFHFHPDRLYIFTCDWNFRSDHCMYSLVCKSAESLGVSVLHGSRSVFHTSKQISFRAVYRAFEEYNFEDDIRWNLVQPIKTYLENTYQTNCGRISAIFLKSLTKYLPLKPF